MSPLLEDAINAAPSHGDVILCNITNVASEALEAWTELKNSGDTVASFLVDQRMPEMEGVDF